jgi:hypothetical protein
MTSWTWSAWCPHHRLCTLRLENGAIVAPDPCCHEQPPRPSRVRIWWETRRLRRWLARLRPEEMA